MYGLSIARASGSERIVTTVDAKAHLHVDHGDEDSLIERLIDAATEHYESQTGHIVRQSDVTLTLPCWPSGHTIPLPRSPVSSVTSVTYLEEGESSATTLSSSLYREETTTDRPAIVLKANQDWPTASLENGHPITVVFVAGYATASVPESDRAAILLMVGHLYENREAVVIGTIATVLQEAYRALVMQRRRWP